MSRYALQDGESEFEPGSNDLVLRNKLGITDPREMELAETVAYKKAFKESMTLIDGRHTFASADLNDLHRRWLGNIYFFAGQYRTVNVSKDGFAFCSAVYISEQMANLDGILARTTPCKGMSGEQLARALAEVHGEFILIHPYREGNGRLGRWLANLMALQAERPVLNFEAGMEGHDRAPYFAAVRRYPSDPSLLENWFLRLLG